MGKLSIGIDVLFIRSLPPPKVLKAGPANRSHYSKPTSQKKMTHKFKSLLLPPQASYSKLRLQFQNRCFCTTDKREEWNTFWFFLHFWLFLSFRLFVFSAGSNFFGNYVILAISRFSGVANLLGMVKNNSLTCPFAISLLCGKFTLENQQC